MNKIGISVFQAINWLQYRLIFESYSFFYRKGINKMDSIILCLLDRASS